MPNIALIRDFSAGWTPSDDSINGRKNGLLQMDNLELDRNGSLSLAAGTSKLGGSYASDVYRLYSRSIGGTRYDYAYDNNGTCLRNGNILQGGGDTSQGGFGTAFDFTLIASGNIKRKDNITSLYNLGVAPPTAAPTYSTNNNPAFHANFISPGVPFNTPVFTNIWGTTTFPGDQAGPRMAMAETPVGSKIYICAYQSGVDPGVPWDMTDMYNPRISPPDQHGFMTDQDMMVINITSPSPNCIASLGSFRLDFLTVAPSGVAVASDFYTYLWTNDGSIGGDSLNLVIRREDFEKVGAGGGQSYWSTVYGVRITLIGISAFTYVIGTDLNPLYVGGTLTLHFNGGTKQALQGTDIQYAQMNVFNTGSYFAKSILGPPTPNLSADMNYYSITPQAATDSSANEVWIFRRGGNLQQWYRVLRILGTGGVPVNDYLSDIDAIDLDIIYNINLISVQAIPEKICDIVGPIEGRWYYFTTNFMYPSDINCPDLVDSSIAVRTTGTNSEVFLWARKISDAAVLCGTSIDIYLLTGTFQTLPDFTVDIYYRSTGCKYPPITADCTAFEGAAYYLAADGWRIATPSAYSQTYGGGVNSTLVSPNIDRLYQGVACYGYNPPNLNIQPGTARFPVLIAKNKLWCCITNQHRIEVFDFTRKYWRVVNYGAARGDVTAITNTQDGNVLAFFGGDNHLRIIDNEKLPLMIDGTDNQTINMLSPVFDGPPEAPMPRNRKDLYTFKARFASQSSYLSVYAVDAKGVQTYLGAIAGPGDVPTEQYLDISGKIPISKTFQIYATGNFSAFNLTDWSVEFDARPSPLTFLRLYNTNFGSASKKRVRVWPQVIDTLGNNATFTPYVDNSPAASTVLNSIDKTTLLTFFKSDVFGIDYGATISGGPFEFWESVNPDVVQILPIARQYDQVGPHEFFRYGRIKQFEIRLLPFGPGATSLLPWKFLFNDNTLLTGNITVTNNEEHSYFIGVPKGTAGTIIRIEFGPTAYNFHRYYVRMQVLPSGQDTELQWVDLPEERGNY